MTKIGSLSYEFLTLIRVILIILLVAVLWPFDFFLDIKKMLDHWMTKRIALTHFLDD